MKNQISLCILLAAALLASSSCSHDTDPGAISPDGRTALTVTSGIQTRAYNNMWEAGDAIGIYMLDGATTEAANKKYITTAGGAAGTFASATTPANQTIYFPVDGSTRDFVAYYPYAAIDANNLYAVNVADQRSQKDIDLMVAEKIIGRHKNDASVAFVFAHKLVKLDIEVKADGASLTDADLTGTTVQITNQQTTGTYNVVEGSDVAVTTSTPTSITLFTNGLKVEGIVLPSTDTEGMKLTFSVPALGDQKFTWAINSVTASKQFEAGKKYKYTITIAKMGVTVTSTVTNWTAGNGEGGESGEAE